MDKRQLSVVITDMFKNLTPSQVSVFLKNADTAIVRVVSDSFKGMTFSSRAKLLNSQFKQQQPSLFQERIYIFEAFTKDEVAQLDSEKEESPSNQVSKGYKESAREAE